MRIEIQTVGRRCVGSRHVNTILELCPLLYHRSSKVGQVNLSRNIPSRMFHQRGSVHSRPTAATPVLLPRPTGAQIVPPDLGSGTKSSRNVQQQERENLPSRTETDLTSQNP